MNRFCLLGLVFLLQNPVYASLVSARNQEIVRLSMCPTLPSVLVLDSTAASTLTDDLRKNSDFINHYQLIDRDQLGEIHPACRAVPESSNSVFMDDVFAMYMIAIEYDPKMSPVAQLQVMRTDTGAILFEKKATIGQEQATLASFIHDLTPQWLAILSKQRNECLNEFTATVTEDVQLRCQGVLPSATEYTIASDFRLIFEIRSFNLLARDTIQSLGGSMTVQPKPAQTVQRLALQHTVNNCTMNIESKKILDINLKERQLPTILHLTIPQNLSHPWLFQPKITSAEPFFMGDAIETNMMTTTGSDQCPEKTNSKKETTQLNFSDYNVFKFAEQEFKPFCAATHFVQPVFVRVPNLGTPASVDITSGCTKTTLNANLTFKRRFYRYQK